MKQSRLIVLLGCSLLFARALPGQSGTLAQSTPEAEGVSSSGISAFLDATAHSKTEFHSFMFLRHGKIIAQGWWHPYRADLRHTLYSCSKSFTATAVGFAIAEKKLSLDDKVVSFFPGDLPDTVSAWLKELDVRDVLMMSDGQDPDPSFNVAARDSNWIRGFLATPIVHEPGTQFLYNSLGTYMLSAIVQKVTGQRVLDYLRPRFFTPLGIRNMDWETDLQGINTGGWGLRLKTEDMAKFAELFLQHGKWNGKQLLPPGWAETASTMKILQDPDAPPSKRDSSDWLQGYCYQMWRCRHDAYRGDGAYGQFMIVMPDQDAVLAITAETPDMQEEINLVWKYLLPACRQGRLPANPAADAMLREKIQGLGLKLPAGDAAGKSGAGGKTFIAGNNSLGLRRISFNFSNASCGVVFADDTAAYRIDFGSGRWQEGTTRLHGPSLVSSAVENTAMLYPAKIAAAYAWTDPQTLELVVRYIETPHTEYYFCHFQGDRLTVTASRSLDFGTKSTTVEATAR